MTAEPAPGAPAAPAPTAAPSPAHDLVLPMVPSVICSLTLEGISELNGTVKIGIAAALGLGLWWFTSGRRTPAARSARGPAGFPPVVGTPGTGGSRTAGGFARANWRWLLLVVVLVAVIALLATRLVFGRPTVATAAIALVVLATTTALAYAGRRTPGAVTGAVAGGLLGLCLGIAVL